SSSHGQVTATPRAGGLDVKGPRMARPFEVRRRLDARPKLGDTAIFKEAKSLIGQRPTLFVSVGPALELAAASPHHASDAHFDKALPRLRHIAFVAAGARRDSGLDVLRAVIGLR